MSEYNLQYLFDLCHNNSKTYEYQKVMHKIDAKISNIKTPIVFHLVPILYSMTFIIGMSVFGYKVII
jgi:hypothetical protein